MICASHSCASCPLVPCLSLFLLKNLSLLSISPFSMRGVDRSIDANVLHPSLACHSLAFTSQLVPNYLPEGRMGAKKNQTIKLQGNSTAEV